MKALKTFFYGIMACLGMLFGQVALAQGQSCSSYDGDGTDSFSTLSTAGYTCLRLSVVEGSTLTFSTSDPFSFFTLYGAEGAFQDFRGTGTSWSYANTPTASDVTIQFAWDPGMVGQSFDYNVSVTAPVPEPSTYALMLAGLFAVGFMAKRKRLMATTPGLPHPA